MKIRLCLSVYTLWWLLPPLWRKPNISPLSSHVLTELSSDCPSELYPSPTANCLRERKKNFVYTFWSLVWSNNEINIRYICRRKTNLVTYAQRPYKNETQGQVRQLRIRCHPELRNGIGNWGFRGEKGNSQNNKNRYLVIGCLPCHSDRSFR